MADLTLVQGDTRPDIQSTLKTAAGTPIDLTEATEVRFQMRLIDGERYVVNAAAEILVEDAGSVRYVWDENDLAMVGDYYGQWQISWSDGSIQTTNPPNTIEVRRQ
jgi:hypothetical protein